MSGTVEPLVGTTPPHPMGVARVLKLSTRNYLAGGTSLTVVLNPITTFVHTVAKAIGGTITKMGPDVPMPATVTVTVYNGATPETTVSCPVTAATGVFAGTIPANALTAGSKTATAASASPPATSASVSFPVT